MCHPLELHGPFDVVVHQPVQLAACLPGSPLQTLEVNSRTSHALEWLGPRGPVHLASTSEVYGDAEVHPGPRTIGACQPRGARSIQRGRRFAEALTIHFGRVHAPVGIVRIFNTYGPRMQPDDGRVVTSFLVAQRDGSLTIRQRPADATSATFDLVAGLVADRQPPGGPSTWEPGRIHHPGA